LKTPAPSLEKCRSILTKTGRSPPKRAHWSRAPQRCSPPHLGGNPCPLPRAPRLAPALGAQHKPPFATGTTTVQQPSPLVPLHCFSAVVVPFSCVFSLLLVHSEHSGSLIYGQLHAIKTVFCGLQPCRCGGPHMLMSRARLWKGGGGCGRQIPGKRSTPQGQG